MVALLFLACVNSANGQVDLWWLGTQAFGGQTGNNGVERVENGEQGNKGNILTIMFAMSILYT